MAACEEENFVPLELLQQTGNKTSQIILGITLVYLAISTSALGRSFGVSGVWDTAAREQPGIK